MRSMFVGIIEIQIRIYGSNSLKDKRRVIKSIIDKIKNRFNVSCSDISNNNLWNRAGIGIALVSNDKSFVNKQINLIFDYVKQFYDIEIINHTIEIL